VFPSALAEDERDRIHKRASEGRKAAQKAGRRFGRKPKLNTIQQARARELVCRAGACGGSQLR
jgi:DNA invertase Pin-like site-specific DNA recombinase